MERKGGRGKNMQQSVGELIRQLRRQRSLTQTELGGDHFSKSYVSAVEREKIVPSSEALRFFAGQLEQSGEYFILLAQENEQEHGLPMAYGNTSSVAVQEDVVTLLDILLENAEQQNSTLLQELPPLPSGIVATLPADKQARYFFLTGLVAQQQQNYPEALLAFEQAMTLAPAHQQPAILDEIGMNYYYQQEYETALLYHKRALLFSQSDEHSNRIVQHLKLHMHCGNAYRALGAYKQAGTQYEQARRCLSATHDLQTAGQLYLGLGYCIYAHAYQNTIPSDSTLPPTHRMTEEEMEHDIQRALSLLIQSRTIYQVCSDTLGESNVRLVQAMTLLDLCTRRKQFAQAKSSSSDMYTRLNYIAPLEDAEEQCRQVLLMWEDSFTILRQPAQELTDILYVALAYLIRIFAQRAAFARLGGYKDTTERELTLATQLCQQALDTLTATNVSWNVIHNAAHIQMSQLVHHAASLPRVPQHHDVFSRGSKTAGTAGKIEIYFAAGEVIEELGRNATQQEYAHECYQRANQCFQVPLAFAQPSLMTSEPDVGDTLRRYQRYISILEERLQAAPIHAEETTKALLNVLKEGLNLSQHTL
jgi:tetratricopeptide (TPR) repeat protein